MNTKSFLLGTLTGFIVSVLLTFGVLIAAGLLNLDFSDSLQIDYLEKPVSYENKSQTSFQVIQVLGGAALACEVSIEELDLYFGTTVLLLGEHYYDDQVITVINPQRVGTYSYISESGDMTVPVIDGEIQE